MFLKTVPKEVNQDKGDAFEKQILSIVETFKRRRQPQPTAPGGPASPAPPPAPQAVAQPVPVQHPDQVNVPQASHPQPPQVNSQPVLPIPSNNQGIQSVQQQQQQQQLLSQMQQEKQIQRQQLTGVGPQATGSMFRPTNNAQSPLQHNPGVLQQTLAGTLLQSTVVPTLQPVGAAMPTSSTGLIGENGLIGLSANSNVPGNVRNPA